MSRPSLFLAAALMTALLPNISYATVAAQAAEIAYPSDPYSVIKLAGDNTFARLKSDSAKIKADNNHLRTIIREELLPYVDARFAAYKVLGANIKQTTPEQREAFVEVFTDYMISSYADALAYYNEQTLRYEPQQPTEGSIASVKVTVLETGKPDVKLEFKLRQNSKTQQWKAFDMIAEGISLISAKQSELGGLIREKGIDAVIVQLREFNQKPLVLKS